MEMSNILPLDNPDMYSKYICYFNRIDFWLCEYAKRRLWKENREFYEDLIRADESMRNVGKLIWGKIFRKEFNKHNYLELIYLYAPRGVSIKHYFKELSQYDLNLIDILDDNINTIISVSETYNFLLCDLLLKTHQGDLDKFEGLKLYILYKNASCKHSKMNFEHEKLDSNFTIEENYSFSRINPMRFPPDKKYFPPTLYGCLEYNEIKDIVTLQLPQITENNCDFEDFMVNLNNFVISLRYEHMKEELSNAVDSLSQFIINCFYHDVKPQENNYTKYFAIALENHGFYSLNNDGCFAKKPCQKLFYSWGKEDKELTTLDQSLCKNSEQLDYRCTCCLVQNIKDLIRKSELPFLPLKVLSDEKFKKLMMAFSQIYRELNTLKASTAKIQKQIISQKKTSKDIDGVESRLLGLFLWDAKHIHGIRTAKLWSHLLEHAEILQYTGFNEKTESWAKKATTTFVTRTEKSIEENRIVPFS